MLPSEFQPHFVPSSARKDVACSSLFEQKSKESGPRGPGFAPAPLGASRTRLGPLSQGLILKKIPQGPAVTPYFEVPARHRERELAQARRAGAALRNGAWPWNVRA
jgi:hypothetical protein